MSDPRSYSGSEEDDAESSAPGELEMVRRFVNTLEVEDEIEHLDSLTGLRKWLRVWDLPASGLSEADLVRAIELREALRELIAANGHAALEPATSERLNAAIAGGASVVRFDRDGACAVVPSGEGFDAAAALIAAGVHEAILVGTWSRLKICDSDTCCWAFFDRSRNHSRSWCRMQECGNRAKVRAFRERQRSR